MRCVGRKKPSKRGAVSSNPLEKNMHFLVEHVNYSGIFNSLLDGIDVVRLDMFGMFVVFWG